MSDARSTYRFALLLLGGSVLVAGALIANGMSSRSAVPVEPEGAAAEAAAALPEQSAFEKWAAEGDAADGKGRLIGEIERDGKMVELRQLPDGVSVDQMKADEMKADQINPDSPADAMEAEQDQPVS